MTPLGFEEQDCIRCGVRFGVPSGYTANRRVDKATFYCPNGHPMTYAESELDRVRRERDRLKQNAVRLEEESARAKVEAIAAVARAETAEKKARRLVARAKAGVCPCCNRSFVELQRHMQTKHPDFAGEVVALRRAKP